MHRDQTIGLLNVGRENGIADSFFEAMLLSDLAAVGVVVRSLEKRPYEEPETL